MRKHLTVERISELDKRPQAYHEFYGWMMNAALGSPTIRKAVEAWANNITDIPRHNIYLDNHDHFKESWELAWPVTHKPETK